MDIYHTIYVAPVLLVPIILKVKAKSMQNIWLLRQNLLKGIAHKVIQTIITFGA